MRCVALLVRIMTDIIVDHSRKVPGARGSLLQGGASRQTLGVYRSPEKGSDRVHSLLFASTSPGPSDSEPVAHYFDTSVLITPSAESESGAETALGPSNDTRGAGPWPGAPEFEKVYDSFRSEGGGGNGESCEGRMAPRRQTVADGSEALRLQRDLDLAMAEKRRIQESAYYQGISHPLEKKAQAKADKDGAPIRENYVKLQVGNCRTSALLAWSCPCI